MDVTFSSPVFLWFLAFIPLLAAVHFYSLHYAKQRAMRFANFEALERIVQTRQVVPNNYLLLAMRVLALICFTLAAAGITLHYEITAPSHDFIVAIDSSSSMLATDIPHTRLAATSGALSGWAASLPKGAYVGLVAFSSQASVLLAPTSDMAAAGRAAGGMAPDTSGGTAICEALRASTNLLLNSENPRAIILIADGKSNTGCLLAEGIEYAKKNGVAVHSIGVGSQAGGRVEGLPDALFRLDDSDLRQAAAETGGTYAMAASPAQLSAALAALNKPAQRQEALPVATYVMLAAFLLVFIDWSLSITRYRAIP